jgi:hypothetical protein
MTNIKTILIYPCYSSSFNYASGGITCSFELARLLSFFYKDVRIFDILEKPNHIYNNMFSSNYINYDRDTTVVIYGETIHGNLLNAKHVVRWILAPISRELHLEAIKSWNPNDLLYYFNSENRFYENNGQEKEGIYKLLSSIHFNPKIVNLNLQNRHGYCHILRKLDFHKSKIQYIHPDDSFEIKENKQEHLIEVFNKHEYFISYDPLSFVTIMAAACGCVSIVYKLEGKTKEEWLQTTTMFEYLKTKNLNQLYGDAYGEE